MKKIIRAALLALLVICSGCGLTDDLDRFKPNYDTDSNLELDTNCDTDFDTYCEKDTATEVLND